MVLSEMVTTRVIQIWLLRSSEHGAYLWCSLLISSLIVVILMTVTSILSWKYSPCALSKRVSFINCLPSSRTSYVSDSTDVKWLSTSWDTNQIKRKLTSFYGPVHSFVPGNQCLGTGTKWCCVHTLSTRYVTVYIVNSTQTPFLRRKLSSEYKAVDCLKSNKNSVHTSSRCSLCAWVQGLNLNLGTGTVPEF